MEKRLKGREIIIYLAIKYNGDWNKIYQAIKAKELVDHERVLEIVKSVKSNVTVIIDDDYPEALKKAYKPPFAIFYYGELKTLRNKKQITMLSQTEPSVTTRKKIDHFADNLSKKYGIITIHSDMNGEVIQRASKNNNLTILGFEGIDTMKEKLSGFNKALLLSEYPGSVDKQESNLPWTVRIASSLGDKLIVSYPEKRSYLGIAIGYSLYLDKQVLTLANKTTKHKDKDENILTVLTVKDVESIMGSATLN